MWCHSKLRRSCVNSSPVPSSRERLAGRPMPRLHAWFFTLCIGFLAISCTPLKSAADRGSGTARFGSTILLNVRFFHALQPDRALTGVVVSVDEEQGIGEKQFAFGPDTRIPGRYTDFLVRMDLSPGRYRVRRLSGVTAGGVIAPDFDVAVDLPLEARSQVAEYLGRIDVSDAGSQATRAERRVGAPTAHAGVAGDALRIDVVDGYEEDLPNLIRAWPSLRARTIERRPLAGVAIARPAEVSPAEAQRAPAPLEELRPARVRGPEVSSAEAQRAATPLEESRPARVQEADVRPAISANGSGERSAPRPFDAATVVPMGLPAKAQAAFRSFLKSAHPRAFAVSESGYYGAASGGKDVARRALINCVRASAPDRQNCRLFAVDDTLLVAPRGPAAAAPPERVVGQRIAPAAARGADEQ